MFYISIITLEILNIINCIHSRSISADTSGSLAGEMVILSPINTEDNSILSGGLDQQFTVQLSHLFMLNLTHISPTSDRALFANTIEDDDEFMTSSEEERYLAEEKPTRIVFPDQLPTAESNFTIDGRAIFQVPPKRKPCPARQRRTRGGQCRVSIRMA